MRRVFPILLSAALLTSLAGCPGGLPDKPTVPDKPDTSGVPDAPDSGGSAVDPDRCGNYASTNIGAKIKTFLKATVALDKAVSDAENHVKLACTDMGKALEMSDDKLKGDTRKVCNAVSEKIKADLKASLKAEAALDITYKPAECVVDASLVAGAQARCEGSGSTGTGGTSGSGACESSAQVEAALAVKCTPAELTIGYKAEVAVDKDKLERAVNALRVGLPKIANVYARLVVIKKAALAWADSAAGLVKAGRSILSDIGDQVLCVSGQLALAADAAAGIVGSIDVSVEVSVEVSGSAGASM
jgi:hypothetical protein